MAVLTAGHERSRRIPKGFYERMLCRSCDGHRFGGWDAWARTFFRDRRSKVLGFFPPLSNEAFEYSPMRLFLLSVLWRAGVAERREWRSVTLEEHEAPLRQMLLEEDPGDPETYPIFGAALRGELAPFALTNFAAMDIGGARTYSAVFAGCEWTWVLCDGVAALDPEYRALLQPLILRPVRKLILPPQDIYKATSIKAWRQSEGSNTGRSRPGSTTGTPTDSS